MLVLLILWVLGYSCQSMRPAEPVEPTPAASN